MNNIERYNKFINTSFNWCERFTWNGVYGNITYSPINLLNYNKETQNLKKINFKNISSFYNQMKIESKRYSKWCGEKFKQLKNDELINLEMFFLGCIGEYFFYKLFNYKNTLYISKTQKIYNFQYICPRPATEYDFGVDLSGCVNVLDKNYDCVFQVKFWNPFSEESFIDNHVAQAAHSDAIENNMINNEDDENIFICWLGNNKNVSKWLSKNKLNRHIVFIDRDVLMENNIDVDTLFWQKMKQDISNI